MAMRGRAYRIVVRPRREWDAVRAENRPWATVLFAHVLPLSLLPALGWAAGLALNGAEPDQPGSPMWRFAASVATTLLLTILCVALLALAFYLLAPAYRIRRDWNRAFSVAGYGTTPVLLAGVLLILPVMLLAGMVAMLHNFLLYYLGLQQVIGCRRTEAAEYLAVSCLLAAMGSGALGAAGGALGVF